MNQTTDATGRDSLREQRSPLLGPVRLAIGLFQGVALWWLWRSADGRPLDWPATEPQLFGPLALVLAFIPVVLLAGVGRMRVRTLGIWSVAATAVLALLGWHDIARQSADTLRWPPFLSFPFPVFAATALFIGHHLILPADMQRRRSPDFAAYFDTAWKAGVQLVLSLGFTGAFWLLLFLGAALFNVIGLKFLGDLIAEDWFAIPVTCLVFAVAVHLTDVRDGLIRGVRTVALMLLSWLLTVLTVLVAGFLIALPFTGLEGLWETGSATALVLSAAGALIILINTAYQDGQPDNRPPAALRVTVQVAAVLLTPLIVIAFWGLALRIGQYGLTPDRIIAAACAVVGAAYAAGYAFAALAPLRRPDLGWMRPLERTNVWTAGLEIAVILALFSPLLDPARLSVADQMARLERGAVTPDRFDYRFLRFESGKAGQAALARLERSSDAGVARRARNARALVDRWEETDEGAPDRLPRFEVVPAGAVLPRDFVAKVPPNDSRARCAAPGECIASPADLNGDDRPEVLVANRAAVQLWVREAAGWRSVGSWSPRFCPGPGERADLRDALREGRVRPATPVWPDMLIDGERATVQLAEECVPPAYPPR
ncbi:DUF4153 domain-containing protein [Brevundimonas sp.]|uniref:DUF4153 domain-containing protein n=1 Tax=Brevundimonas sp. TaxID=1871086 RepID=UPI002FC7B4EF